MRKALLILVLCFSGLLFSRAQQAISISEPHIEQDGGIIRISFDILNSTPEQFFNIEIRITNAQGVRFPVGSLTGDAGERIRGGRDKQVSWDPVKDGVQMNEQVFVEVLARPVKGVVASGTSYKRSTLVLQSLPLPGLGLSRYTGKPHWIRGVVAYGCVAGAVVLNRMAASNYESISTEPDFNEKVNLHEKAVSQDRTSEILGWSALGIWVADVVWTVMGSSDLKGRGMKWGLSFGGGVDPHTSVPLLNVCYRF